MASHRAPWRRPLVQVAACWALTAAAARGWWLPGKAREAEPARVAALPFLRVEGDRVVDESGRPVSLRGCNIGSWLLIEPWMLGIEGWERRGEKELWDLLRARFGEAQTLDLIRTHRENFFTEDDVRRIAALGLNALRIPVWWRALEDPAYGGDVAYLDRALDWCERHGVYVILDLHGAPGGQSDEPGMVGEQSGAALWRDPAHKEHTVQLWKSLASRYKDRAVVAGYDLLNEAIGASFDDLVAFYDRLYDEIRQVDPRHILILEDGLHGFHRLPPPEDFEWQNVVYSFHYYPQSTEEGLTCAAQVLHRFNRAALYYGVPAYVGEFNTILTERGGAATFLRCCEVFDYYGWPWTFWSYKKIGDNRDTIWGLYGFYRRRPTLDPEKGSYEEIRAALESMRTERSEIRPLLKAALELPPRWREIEASDGRLTFDLRQAFVLRAEQGDMLIEWQREDPNVGYWLKGDTVAWRIQVPQAGVYEVGLEMANNSESNRVGLWIDGVHAISAPVAHSGGWQSYRDQALGCFELTAGGHVVEIAQDDETDGFINLRRLWLRPTAGPALTPDEEGILLKPINMSPLRRGSPLRVEWLNDPPNVGFWSSRERAAWDFVLQAGGDYPVSLCYSTPHETTRLRILLDGREVLGVTLRSTGGWGSYREAPCGRLHVEPGPHRIELCWETGAQAGAGNLRRVRLERARQDEVPLPDRPSEGTGNDDGDPQENVDPAPSGEARGDL